MTRGRIWWTRRTRSQRSAADSLAGALVAGIAHRLNAILVHKNPELEALNGTVDLEALPYKQRSKIG